jgi:GNAT superfamily N-acetyltransferase
MAILIVHADETMLDAVSPLFDSYRQFYGQSLDADGARAFVADRLAKGDSAILLASDGSHFVGFIQLYPSFSSVAMTRVWILNDLFVAATARRKGIGTKMLQAAVSFARDSNATRLVLATAVDNDAAQQLYLNQGWKLDTQFKYFNLTVTGD